MPKKSKASKIKKILDVALSIYVGAYVGLAGFAAYDSMIHNEKRIETKAKNFMIVKNYKVNLEGKVKELTVVGEIHSYNHVESKYAKELLWDHYKVRYIALEGGSASGRSKASKRYAEMLRYIYTPYFLFYGEGSGRRDTNPTISSYAWRSNTKICYLLEAGKDDAFDNLSFGQKSVFLSLGVYSLLKAPLGYYEGKRELVHGNGIKGGPAMNYATNLHKRDKTMADNIAKLIKVEHIDKLMCVIGRDHVKGVVKHLKSSLEMEEHRTSQSPLKGKGKRAPI